MQSIPSSTLLAVLKLVTCVLIGRVIVGVLTNYSDYMPPNFASEFLRGRDGYFHGIYAWAFYAHIVSGPFSLAVGMVLLSEKFRRRYSKWHRRLGRVHVGCVLLLVVPSGLWMARYAASGGTAGGGFAMLAATTGASAALGWNSARRRRFVEHRLWMWRCYVLLCSAVVLRLQAGLATVFAFDSWWLYPFAAWTCWLVPLLAFELCNFARRESG